MAPRNVNWAKKKIGLEKYFLHKMKRGVSEPYYENAILKARGIVKLEKPA